MQEFLQCFLKWTGGPQAAVKIVETADFIRHSNAIGLTLRRPVAQCTASNRVIKYYKASEGPAGPDRQITTETFEQPWYATEIIDELRSALMAISTFPAPTNGSPVPSADFTMDSSGQPVPYSFDFLDSRNVAAETIYHQFFNFAQGTGANVGFGSCDVILTRRRHVSPVPFSLFETKWGYGAFQKYAMEGPSVCTSQVASSPIVIEPAGSALFTPDRHLVGYIRACHAAGTKMQEFVGEPVVPC